MTKITDIPDDVLGEIFSYFEINKTHRKQTDIRHFFSRQKVKVWFRVMVTCKKFLRVGRRIFDPSIKSDSAFRNACSRGSIEYVTQLLQDVRVDPSSVQDDALIQAVKNNQIAVVKLLLQDPHAKLETLNSYLNYQKYFHSDQKTLISEFIQDPAIIRKSLLSACSNNRLSVVKYLISAYGYHEGCLKSSAASDALDVTEELLKFAKPRFNDLRFSGPKSFPLLLKHWPNDQSLDHRKLFMKVCSLGNVEKIQSVLDNCPIDVIGCLDEVFEVAITRGQPKVIKFFFITFRLPQKRLEELIWCACKQGISCVVKDLLDLYEGNPAYFLLARQYWYGCWETLSALKNNPRFLLTEEYKQKIREEKLSYWFY